MEFSITTLGTASALPTANRYPSAHVVKIHERLFLIDCGEGAQMQMRKANIPFSKIDNIFISHLHGDHVFGIFGFLSTLAMSGRLCPLYIYAPKDFDNILTFFMKQFGEGVKYEIVHIIVECKSPKIIMENKKIEVLSFPLKHRGETYGYIFREKMPKLNIHKHLIEPYNLSLKEIASLKDAQDVVREDCVLSYKDFTYLPFKPRQLAYCSDTAPFAKLATYVEGSDLIYHEATFAQDLAQMAKTTLHSTAKDAASLAVKAGASKLIIGHFSSRYKSLDHLLEEAKEIFSNTILGKEGTKIDI